MDSSNKRRKSLNNRRMLMSSRPPKSQMNQRNQNNQRSHCPHQMNLKMGRWMKKSQGNPSQRSMSQMKKTKFESPMILMKPWQSQTPMKSR